MALGPLAWLPLSFVDAACHSMGIAGVLGFSSLLGGHSRSLGGRCLPVVALFGCGDRGVGWLLLYWAAGMVCGGVGRVTWHAGNMVGARVVGDVAVWLLGLCGCCVSFAGSCHGSWAAGVVIGGGVTCGQHGGRAQSSWLRWVVG